MNIRPQATALAVYVFMLTSSVFAQDFDKGLQSYQAGDYATAFGQWQPLAEQGNARAQVALGLMYNRGAGVPQDASEAVRLFELAAAQGYVNGQFNLGVMYGLGRGVPQDSTMTALWYSLAAEQGHVKAQYNLGSMYAHGEGVTQNKFEAGIWYRRAANQGFSPAQFNLGLMYYEGDGWLLGGYPEAMELFRAAAKQGHANAQLNLGLMYYWGEGTARDLISAHMWMTIARESGAADADAALDLVTPQMTPDTLNEAETRRRACRVSNYENCD